jgi:hypothetical protein
MRRKRKKATRKCSRKRLEIGGGTMRDSRNMLNEPRGLID